MTNFLFTGSHPINRTAIRGLALRAVPMLALLSSAPAFAVDHPPADHAGADFSPANGERVWGLHTGVGTFTVAPGTTVTVAAYDGSTTAGRGFLEIRAARIAIHGTLSATGSGYSGGSGGGGGAQGAGGFFDPQGVLGSAGQAAYGGEFFRGAAGGGAVFTRTTGGPTSGFYSPGPGGAGGTADGSYRGTGAAGPGSDGGYAAIAANGDSTLNGSTSMGSGGAGGGGAAGGGSSRSMGGGAGGNGGGAIRLSVTSDLAITTAGRIVADGVAGGNGAGPALIGRTSYSGRGGHVTPSGSGTGADPGGSGAGGGILLKMGAGATATFSSGSVIRTLGGRNQMSNGGTIKILGDTSTPPIDNLTLQSPRQYTAFSAAVNDWSLYSR